MSWFWLFNRRCHFCWLSACLTLNVNRVVDKHAFSSKQDPHWDYIEQNGKRAMALLLSFDDPVILFFFPSLPRKLSFCHWLLDSHTRDGIIVYNEVRSLPAVWVAVGEHGVCLPALSTASGVLIVPSGATCCLARVELVVYFFSCFYYACFHCSSTSRVHFLFCLVLQYGLCSRRCDWQSVWIPPSQVFLKSKIVLIRCFTICSSFGCSSLLLAAVHKAKLLFWKGSGCSGQS